MAIAGATVSMGLGAVQAFTSMSSIPYVGPALGAIAAAAVIMKGMQNIAMIESTSYSPRAFGGPVTAGQTYLVGEQGPELMVAGADGTIIPNNKLGGQSQPNVTQVFQISTGVVDTVRAEIRRAAPAMMQMAVQAVRGSMREGEFQGV